MAKKGDACCKKWPGNRGKRPRQKGGGFRDSPPRVRGGGLNFMRFVSRPFRIRGFGQQFRKNLVPDTLFGNLLRNSMLSSAYRISVRAICLSPLFATCLLRRSSGNLFVAIDFDLPVARKSGRICRPQSGEIRASTREFRDCFAEFRQQELPSAGNAASCQNLGRFQETWLK